MVPLILLNAIAALEFSSDCYTKALPSDFLGFISKKSPFDFFNCLEDKLCKKNYCKSYIEYIKDGKQLYEKCLKKNIISLCGQERIKCEDAQLIIQTFVTLEQFIIFDIECYRKALKNCDIFQLFLIARYQFEIYWNDCSIAFFRCLEEYKKGPRDFFKICEKDNTITIKYDKFFPCVIPYFCVNPRELLCCPVEIDLRCFKFILLQIKECRYYNCDSSRCNKFEELFYKSCQINCRKTIIRIKIVILLLVTDLRINCLDTTFAKYCHLLLRNEKHGFLYNIDPVVKCIFGAVLC